MVDMKVNSVPYVFSCLDPEIGPFSHCDRDSIQSGIDWNILINDSYHFTSKHGIGFAESLIWKTWRDARTGSCDPGVREQNKDETQANKDTNTVGCCHSFASNLKDP